MTAEQRAALEAVVKIDPSIMHGTPCFSGTRMPVQTLIDFLETGETVDDFLKVYPHIPREQAVAFLLATNYETAPGDRNKPPGPDRHSS